MIGEYLTGAYPQLPVAYQTILAAGEVARDNISSYAANNSRNLTEALYQTIANNSSYVAKEVVNQPPPGFESILGITGLLAVAFLVLGRRE